MRPCRWLGFVRLEARLKVLTLIDRLTASGGGERLAIQIATQLDPDRFESVICASRRPGPVGLDPSVPVAKLSLIHI